MEKNTERLYNIDKIENTNDLEFIRQLLIYIQDDLLYEIRQLSKYRLKKLKYDSCMLTNDLYKDLFQFFIDDNTFDFERIKLLFINTNLENLFSQESTNDLAYLLMIVSLYFLVKFDKWLDEMMKLLDSSLTDDCQNGYGFASYSLFKNFDSKYNSNYKKVYDFVKSNLLGIGGKHNNKAVSDKYKDRFKNQIASVKKIIRNPKFMQQLQEIGMIEDVVGVTKFCNNDDEMMIFYKTLKESIGDNKIRDVNYFDKNADIRKHSIREMIPFINISTSLPDYEKKIVLGEISIRYSNQTVFAMICEDMKENNIIDYKGVILDKYMFWRKIIIKHGSLNHSIYRFIQDIDLIYMLLVKNNLKLTNLNKFVNFRLKTIVEEIFEEFKSFSVEVLIGKEVYLDFKREEAEDIIENVVLDLIKDKLMDLGYDVGVLLENMKSSKKLFNNLI